MESRRDPFNFDRCDFCGYGTNSQFNLLEHMRQHQTKLQNPTVLSCDSNLPENYKCEDCDFETNLKVIFTHHTNIKHKNLSTQNPFRIVLRKCIFCNFQTYSMLLLMKHCLDCDKRNLADKVHNWLECEQCSYKAKDCHYLRKHIEEKHLRYTVREDRLKMQIVSPNIVCYQCEGCEYKTKWKNDLKKHMKVHTDSASVLWYHCDKCDLKTKWKESLTKHIARIHTDAANSVWHQCDKCEYKSKWKDALKRHLITIHTDSSNIVWYHCNKCTHKTKWKAELKRHKAKMHRDFDDIGWYHCDKCKHKTKYRQELKRHKANIHKDSGNIIVLNHYL